MARDFEIRILGDATKANAAVESFSDKLKNAFTGGSQQAQTFKGSLAGSFLGTALSNVAAQATDAVADFFQGSISQASDLQETMSKSTAIFGDSAGALEAFGNNAAKNIGMSKASAMGAAAGFGDMFTQLGYTNDAAAAMSQQVLLAAADLGSFSNLDTADVADRMSAAFRGEYDSLQAVIPNINAARVESEAMAATGKTVASELTAQEKAAAVLAIVQKDGARAMGDFAKTSDGAANKSKIATAMLEDQQAVLGEKLLPIYTEFQSFLITAVVPAISTIIDFLSQNQWVFGVIGGIILATLVPAFVAWAVSTWALTAALLANPITWIILAIVALIAAIVLLVMNWDTVVAWITEVWSGFIGWITEVINGFVGWWNSIWAAVGQWISDVWNGIVTGVTNYFQMLWLGIQIIGAIISNWWNGLWSGIGNFIAGIWNGIVNAVQGAMNWVGNIISSVLSTINNVWSNMWGGMVSFFGNIFGGIVGIAKAPINGVISLINGAIRALNGFSVTIPDWVPGIGGQTWGLSIPTIPHLATGTVTNGPMLAIIGDNPGGREVVQPVSTYQDELRRAYESGQQNSSGGSDADRPIYADGMGLIGWIREVANGEAQLVWNTAESDRRRIGSQGKSRLA